MFRPATASTAFAFPAPSIIGLSRFDTIHYGPATPINVEGLLDLNGDGLPDSWCGQGGTGSDPCGGSGGAGVRPNDGAAFELGSLSTFSNVRPGTDGYPVSASGAKAARVRRSAYSTRSRAAACSSVHP